MKHIIVASLVTYYLEWLLVQIIYWTNFIYGHAFGYVKLRPNQIAIIVTSSIALTCAGEFLMNLKPNLSAH